MGRLCRIIMCIRPHFLAFLAAFSAVGLDRSRSLVREVFASQGLGAQERQRTARTIGDR